MPSIINATTTNGLVTSADNSGELRLQTNSGTNAITIGTTQNVAVGSTDTTSSGGKLVVVPTNTTGSSAYQALDCTNYVDSNFQVNITGSASTDKRAVVGTTTNTSVAFVTASTERMRISNAGTIFIKCTAAPSASVFGSAFIDNGVGASVLHQSTSITSANALQAFYNPNGNVGSVGTSGSNAYYSTTSDYRLKENIAPMTGALDKVALLKPCSYTWKNSKENSQGFIAHELAEVCPQAVVGEKDAVDEEGKPFYQSIDTSFLVATLTAAIQELNAKVDAQAAEIQALKGVA